MDRGTLQVARLEGPTTLDAACYYNMTPEGTSTIHL